MVTGIVAAVTALLGLLSIILEAWCKAAPQRQQEARDDKADTAIQTERRRLADNDGPGVDAIAADQHDRVLAALGDDTRWGDDHRAEAYPGYSLPGQRKPVEGVTGVPEQVNHG